MIKRSLVITALLFQLLLLGCASPRIEYVEYERKVNETSKNLILSKLDASDSKYSILLFTEVFENDILKVENGDLTIFQDTVVSDPSLGLAKSIRVVNLEDIKVTDVLRNYSFTLKKSININYKYIYISKEKYQTNIYKVTYSNSLRPFF
ncbi:hypothetical protein PN465_21190 [Nodularia spumigena CS-584]|nr:hypothetical protein [Nodularia spumigena CS-584]